MNTIRELKQQEKYKTMLKRKNKEKKKYKDINSTLRIKYEGIKKLLEKKDKEIERLNNIINELEKYINKLDEVKIFERLYVEKGDILDKIQELKGDGSNE